MTTQQTTEPTAPANGTVRLTKFGEDTQTLDFTPGMALGDYLTRAEINVGDGNVITVNGEPANPEDILELESVVVVAGKVRNG